MAFNYTSSVRDEDVEAARYLSRGLYSGESMMQGPLYPENIEIVRPRHQETLPFPEYYPEAVIPENCNFNAFQQQFLTGQTSNESYTSDVKQRKKVSVSGNPYPPVQFSQSIAQGQADHEPKPFPASIFPPKKGIDASLYGSNSRGRGALYGQF